MNSSTSSQNGSTVVNRDSYNSAITKNTIVIALGLTINYINGMLIHIFRKHQIFYTNPRYILFIHLVLNDIIQLTTAITLFVSSYIFYRINASICCVIITFTLFTTLNSPLNLAVMAMECYIAICFPLRHAQFCTIRRTYILIAGIWVLSSLCVLPDIFLVVATEPVELFGSTIFCERETLFRHPVSKQKREVLYGLYLAGVWVVLFYTYFHIFCVAKVAKSGDVRKARNTILLHAFQLLLCILTYVFHLVVRSLLYLFPQSYTHVIFPCYVLIQIMPRFVCPFVYGLRDRMFRQHLKKYLMCAVGFKPWRVGKAKVPMSRSS